MFIEKSDHVHRHQSSKNRHPKLLKISMRKESSTNLRSHIKNKIIAHDVIIMTSYSELSSYVRWSIHLDAIIRETENYWG